MPDKFWSSRSNRQWGQALTRKHHNQSTKTLSLSVDILGDQVPSSQRRHFVAVHTSEP
jgi:hypothetical protein